MPPSSKWLINAPLRVGNGTSGTVFPVTSSNIDTISGVQVVSPQWLYPAVAGEAAQRPKIVADIVSIKIDFIARFLLASLRAIASQSANNGPVGRLAYGYQEVKKSWKAKQIRLTDAQLHQFFDPAVPW